MRVLESLSSTWEIEKKAFGGQEEEFEEEKEDVIARVFLLEIWGKGRATQLRVLISWRGSEDSLIIL